MEAEENHAEGSRTEVGRSPPKPGVTLACTSPPSYSTRSLGPSHARQSCSRQAASAMEAAQVASFSTSSSRREREETSIEGSMDGIVPLVTGASSRRDYSAARDVPFPGESDADFAAQDESHEEREEHTFADLLTSRIASLGSSARRPLPRMRPSAAMPNLNGVQSLTAAAESMRPPSSRAGESTAANSTRDARRDYLATRWARDSHSPSSDHDAISPPARARAYTNGRQRRDSLRQPDSPAGDTSSGSGAADTHAPLSGEQQRQRDSLPGPDPPARDPGPTSEPAAQDQRDTVDAPNDSSVGSDVEVLPSIVGSCETSRSPSPVVVEDSVSDSPQEEKPSSLPPLPEPTRQALPPLLANVTCPICFESPKNAVSTPCGHVFCGECIFQVVKRDAEKTAGEARARGETFAAVFNSSPFPVNADIANALEQQSTIRLAMEALAVCGVPPLATSGLDRMSRLLNGTALPNTPAERHWVQHANFPQARRLLNQTTEEQRGTMVAFREYLQDEEHGGDGSATGGSSRGAVFPGSGLAAARERTAGERRNLSADQLDPMIGSCPVCRTRIDGGFFGGFAKRAAQGLRIKYGRPADAVELRYGKEYAEQLKQWQETTGVTLAHSSGPRGKQGPGRKTKGGINGRKRRLDGNGGDATRKRPATMAAMARRSTRLSSEVINLADSQDQPRALRGISSSSGSGPMHSAIDLTEDFQVIDETLLDASSSDLEAVDVVAAEEVEEGEGEDDNDGIGYTESDPIVVF